jgi:hypothetical protein
MSQYGVEEQPNEENRRDAGSHFRNEHDSHHCNPHQVNDRKMSKGGMNYSEAKQGLGVGRKRESAPMLITSMTTGIIKTILLRSEHTIQARQTMTPSAMMN